MHKVSENPFKNRADDPTLFMVTSALFITFYLTSNVMAVKVIGLADFFYFDAATLTFPMAYMLGDVITEIWGFRAAKRVIFTTFACNACLVLFTQLGVYLPSPEHLQETARAYEHIFSYVPRIVLASFVGFLLGELSNAYLMEKIKIAMKGQMLWVRTIASSAVAYIFDTLPFVLIAFYGVVTTRELLLMLALQYASKLFIEAFMGTPLAYLGVWTIRRLQQGGENEPLRQNS